MIRLTGATGNTGGQVAAELRRRGVPFRAMARALEAGYDQAYLVATPDERMVAREQAFVDAVRLVGVRHVVKLSAFLAAHDAPTGAGHSGQAYDLTGPEGLSFAAQASILQEAFGRPVSFVDGDDADMARAMTQAVILYHRARFALRGRLGSR